jgi:hypothetical protein
MEWDDWKKRGCMKGNWSSLLPAVVRALGGWALILPLRTTRVTGFFLPITLHDCRLRQSIFCIVQVSWFLSSGLAHCLQTTYTSRPCPDGSATPRLLLSVASSRIPDHDKSQKTRADPISTLNNL